MSIPFTPEDLPEMFSVMKEQEVSSYKVEDYLNPNYQVPRAAPGDLMCMPPDAGPATSSTHSVGTNSSAAGVNEDWRGKICEWSYQVIDHFDYDREIVAVSVHYLDRYLCQRPVNKRTFQLCAMTTLFMACKLYDLNKLRMSAIIELSRGSFTEEHITAMEMSILNKLSWQVHPPTPLTFARHFVLILKPTACEPAVWHDMMEVAKFLTELTVIDYHFAPLKPSSVGLAALMTSMEGVAEDRLAMVDKQNFATNVYHVAQVSPNDPEVMDCRTRLRTMYYEGGIFEQQREGEAAAAAQANRERLLAAERTASESPTSVQVDVAAAHGAEPPALGLDASITAALVASVSHNDDALDTTIKTNVTSSASSSTGAAKDETEASAATTIAGKAKKLLQDAICSTRKTEGAKKRRKT